MQEFILSDLRNTKLFNDLASICRSHSIMISAISDLRSGGSGTLVQYKNLYGILTALHVIVDHISTTHIYSPILRTPDPAYFLNESIQIKKILYIDSAEGLKALKKKEVWPEGALDICLIQVEKTVFDYILSSSGKKAVDLATYKDLYLANFEKYCSSDLNKNWSWAIEGSPREGGAQSSQGILELKFDGLFLCGGAKDGSTYKAQCLTLVLPPFDIAADIGCHDLGPTADQLPSKFDGISGSGIWQVSFAGKDGIPEKIDEMFFAGLCVAGNKQSLYSRGPTSLYDVFIKYLDTFE